MLYKYNYKYNSNLYNSYPFTLNKVFSALASFCYRFLPNLGYSTYSNTLFVEEINETHSKISHLNFQGELKLNKPFSIPCHLTQNP